MGDYLPAVSLDTFGESELDALEPRTAHILRMRSGIWDGEKHTYGEIGEELGIKGEACGSFSSKGSR